MVDTKRGYFPEMMCSDCGVKGCSFIHNGDTVPEGTLGCFCSECWTARVIDFNETGITKPLGTVWRLMPQEFVDKAIRVQTGSGAVYMLGEPLKETSSLVTPIQKQLALHRTVLKEGINLSFTHAAIMLLRIGESMFLTYFNKEELQKLKNLKTVKNIWARADVYHTTPVVSISCSETKDGMVKTVAQSEDIKRMMKSLFG
ncbi:MAG: hypothetical protein ABIA08_00235 [bacterium]